MTRLLVPRSDENVTVAGVTRTLAEWARELDYSVPSLQQRIRKIGVELALTTPKPTTSSRGRLGAKKGGWSKIMTVSAKASIERRSKP